MHTATHKAGLPVHHRNPALFLEKSPPPLSLQYTHLRLGAVLLALHAAVPGTSTPVHATRRDWPGSAPAAPNQLVPTGGARPPPEAPSSLYSRRKGQSSRNFVCTTSAAPTSVPAQSQDQGCSPAEAGPRTVPRRRAKPLASASYTDMGQGAACPPFPRTPPHPPHLPASTWTWSCYGSRCRPSAQPRRSRSGRTPRRGGGSGGVPSPGGGGKADWNPAEPRPHPRWRPASSPGRQLPQ